ncbi:hypothetical protein NIES4071_58560 [Calothrix sp. NIES-4071]|nr:hypothetical protein NIES4071_58560 [Calothrix sp. NIES-4071]BAZ60163.1 hypothetical protein NIES4105_58510 [Calothrix sp. NIES-4105]
MDDELSGVNPQKQVIARKVCSRTNNSFPCQSPKKHRHEESNNNQSLQQDEQLCQLIKIVLLHEVKEKDRQRAMNGLLKLIPKLRGIKKNLDPRINYDEALNLAFSNVWQKITTFPRLYNLDIDNADAAFTRLCFVKWFNKILQRRIFDLYRTLGQQPLSLQECIEVEGELGRDNLEQIADQEFLDKLQNYLTHDPDRILQCHPEGFPQCSCQELIYRRLLKEVPEKWRDIAQDLSIPQGTVTAFWNRKCKLILQQIPNKLR